MSKQQTESKKKIHTLPLVIKKCSINPGPNTKYGLFRCFPGVSGSFIKEDLLYKAAENDFFKGKYPGLRIVNQLDLTKNSSRTTATYTGRHSSMVELSSDAVVRLIGQDNYDQVFASLCCVINQELKIKGILALLCLNVVDQKEYSTVDTQTNDSSFSDLIKEKKRLKSKQNRRNKVRSYIVQESKPINVQDSVICPVDLENLKPIKVEQDEIIDPQIGNCSNINKHEIDDNERIKSYIIPDNNKRQELDNNFPDLRQIVDEDSNISDVDSNNCNLSIDSSFSLNDLDNKAKSILNTVVDCTKHSNFDNQVPLSRIIEMADGSKVMVKGDVDPFHIAMPDILKDFSPTDKQKLVLHQGYMDWIYCLHRDEDNNLPIHLAVLNNDVDMLKRQCVILNIRHESVDILAPGKLTALQISILQDFPECTEMLLARGADVMVRDEESRTTLHLAAEKNVKHVHAIITHCKNNARDILFENQDLWKPEFQNKPVDKFIDYLLTQLGAKCDDQGYTPLMLASKVGNAEVVELLVGMAPSTVNMAMPTCGNTALYLAAGAAYTDAASRGDKTNVPENYKRVIEILIKNGADPAIDNSSGSNVNDLLSECQDIKLSTLIASTLAAFNGYSKCHNLMLVKDEEGVINVRDIKKASVRKKESKAQDEMKSDSVNVEPETQTIANSEKNINKDTNTDKPIIVKNVPVVTKLVSLKKSEPLFLGKSIATKKIVDSKVLKTNIVAKSKLTKINIPPLVPIGNMGNVSEYLRILPKSEIKSTKRVIIQPVSKTVQNGLPKIMLPMKKKPLILRNIAIKRPTTETNQSPSSSSKVPRV